MTNKQKSRYLPLIIAISVVIGILIGVAYAKQFTSNRMGIINTSSNKINAVLRVMDNQYVDTINMNEIVEGAMPRILSELDPHSVYIPAKNMQEVESELQGSFSGIGVQFSILRDTIYVSKVLSGGPAEKVGLEDGDRIVNVDDSLISKKGIKSMDVLAKLKGPKGSTVKLGVKRDGFPGLLDFTITRGDIPQKSVDAAYVIPGKDNKKWGYIKIDKFAVDTHVELLTAIAQLQKEHVQGYIIDLRNNTGGYLQSAIRMINEFLPKGRLIVYAEGRKFPRLEEHANGAGSCQKAPIVVLINESSASASEIFAGAIQDNDRGTIIGRRSFGKGLVQQPINFKDGSGIRLTVARYYTPSGRCIQRPYKIGDDMQYEKDWYNRFRKGESMYKDSIHLDSTQVYHTSIGRKVYAGGGIMPDIFVPEDTTGITSYYIELYTKRLFAEFALRYCADHRQQLKKFETPEQMISYLNKKNIMEKFIAFADANGVKRRNILISKSYKRIKTTLEAVFVSNMFDNSDYVRYLNKGDNTIDKAVEVLGKEEAYPTGPIDSIYLQKNIGVHEE